MKLKLLVAVLIGLIVGVVSGFILKPRTESEVEKDARLAHEWVNTPVHYVIKWEDGRKDSVYSFEKCPGASKSCPFTVRIGDWQHMKIVKPTCDYTVERL